MGRLHPVRPAERRRHADRAALVAADGHVGLAEGDEDGAARRGAPGRVVPLVRVVHRPRGIGVAAARQAEVLAVRLAEDGAAGVEDPGHDGGVHLGHVALEGGGAVHHGHAGQHDVVLQHDRLSLQLPRGRALDRALVVPGVVLVLLGTRPVTRRARVGHRREVVRQAVDDVVALDARLHERDERVDVGVGQREPHLGGDGLHLVRCGDGDWHGILLRRGVERVSRPRDDCAPRSRYRLTARDTARAGDRASLPPTAPRAPRARGPGHRHRRPPRAPARGAARRSRG